LERGMNKYFEDHAQYAGEVKGLKKISETPNIDEVKKIR